MPEQVKAVRDSKNPDGAKLAFSPKAWKTFTGSLKRGDGEPA
jgi:Domain of unknown function (DUF397)